VPELEYRAAIRAGIDEEMARDSSVVLFGEDVAFAGGVFQVTRGLYETHGPERVLDTPISELAITGAAFGSAITGLRPVIEIMFGDFMALAMDSLINQSAKYWFMSKEQASVPLVVRSAVGGGGRFGAIHSQIPAPWLMGVPGLKIAVPATPADARALMVSAIRDDNPVLFLEHKRLYTLKGDVDGEVVPLGQACVVREGTDITIATAMKGVYDAQEAAATLEEDGISVEIVDLRTLRPLDAATVLASFGKTGRLLVVEEGPATGGWAAEVLARVTESGEVTGEAWRLTCPYLPLGFSPSFEDEMLPGPEQIVASVRSRLGQLSASAAS
jgi:acetoin:2,6-dichlorophenolindophenol oxidoreductase subunit beta